MEKNKLLKVGVMGTVVAAICCFTPILVILMGVAGLAAWTGKLDLVLFPLLGMFLAVTVFAFLRRERA